MEIKFKTSQNMTVSQNTIQQVAILQMSSQELTEYMKEMSLENPVMDLEESRKENKEEERLRKLEWLSEIDDQNRIYYRQEGEDSDQNNILNVGLSEEKTLEQDLMDQLVGKAYTKRQFEVFEYIAASLNDCGYFTEDVKSLAVRFQMDTTEAGDCLSVMKGLEPAGVCAAELSECLWIQLDRMEKTDELAVEKRIVKEYLELLAKNQLHLIAQRLKQSDDRIQQAKEKIHSLNPKPSSGYSCRENLKYLTPDVTVVKLADYFEILIHDDNYPSVQMNKGYMDMLKSGECEKEVQHYLSEKVRQIEQLQFYITRRNAALMGLTHFLVERQKDFFQYGKGRLRPLRMGEAAEAMGVHESTVSRTVRDKYLQCCWGIFPLEYFFTRGVNSGAGSEELAAEQIKERLKEIIEAENKKKPYSDQKLSEELEKSGIKISRRTVAKYRESMNIPDCRGRKVYG